jgi:hypothetical protein
MKSSSGAPGDDGWDAAGGGGVVGGGGAAMAVAQQAMPSNSQCLPAVTRFSTGGCRS